MIVFGRRFIAEGTIFFFMCNADNTKFLAPAAFVGVATIVMPLVLRSNAPDFAPHGLLS